MTRNRPHPCPPEPAGWWAGHDEESLDVGPLDTKEQAIDEALYAAAYCEEQDEDGKWQAHMYVGHYQRVHVDLSRKFDAQDWVDRIDENLEDEEGPDMNGDNPPLEELTKEDIAALEESVRLAIWHWQNRRGLKLASYWLSATGPSGYEVRPLPDGADG